MPKLRVCAVVCDLCGIALTYMKHEGGDFLLHEGFYHKDFYPTGNNCERNGKKYRIPVIEVEEIAAK